MERNCKKLLNEFESKVIVTGYFSNSFKKNPEVIVPLRKTKLLNTDFGEFVGREFNIDSSLVNKNQKSILSINYYGLFKLSSNIFKIAQKAEKTFGVVRTVKSPVVYFNSIRIEHIKKIAPEMLTVFPELKNYLVKLRWNR